MHVPKRPANEADRLQALMRQRILDTSAEIPFDDIVKLAAFICGTPTALISLVDDERQWFKAKTGLPEDLTETARDISFCGHLVYDGQSLVVPDVSADPRFHDNPLVTELGVRFYAGHPLTTEDGHTLGSLCVIDQTPRELSAAQRDALGALARQVMNLIAARREAIEQKRIAAELTASQALMKRFFTRDDVWMGIVELDGDTIVQVYNNPRTQGYLTSRGVDPTKVERGDTAVVVGDWFRWYQQCADTKSRQTFEFESAPEGKVRTLRAIIHYIGLSDRGLPQMSFMVDDVTKQREDERLLDAQKQLVIQSSKLSALGEMAAGMAHEINNPLAIIGGRAQELRMLLERGAPQSRLMESLASIDRTVERISKIIRGLRSFARDASQDPMVPAKVGEILQDTLSFCTARFHAHGIRLDVALAAEDVELSCRPAELSQVFLNLLNNAHDAVAGREQKPWVRVDLLAAPDFVEVAFTDAGVGIPGELRDKIMQPFFTTKAVNQGTGLGLSIARGIVEAHGGSLNVDATCANTRFIVRLPRPVEDKRAS